MSKESVVKKAPTTSENYQQLVLSTTTLVRSLHRDILQFYWDLGDRVYLLLSQPGTYGKARLEQFAEDLEKRGAGLKTSALYDAQSIRVGLTIDELNKLKEAGLSLRKVLFLTRKSVPESDRKALVEEIAKQAEKEKDKNFDVEGAVRKRLGEPEKPETSRDRDSDVKRLAMACKIIKGASGIIEMLAGKLKGIGDSAKIICRCDDAEKINAAHENFDAARSKFDTLVNQWNRESTEAAKILNETTKELKKG